MTNFKKVLSLSLAMATLLSTIAQATFTDNDDISLTEAVETLVALNVIKGYEDGSFKPENTVNRGEMAKMIFTIKNGGSDDASAFEGLSTTFTDIDGHWAEGYIKYCQSQGIIAGKSETIFDPNADVTGTEILKMSLVTLGYRADQSGLVGSSWASNTLALSFENGLTLDYIGSLASPSQRQSAAQILYNSLYTETVKYSSFFDDYTGTEKTLAEVSMNLATYENVYIKDSDVKAGLSFTTDATLETSHSSSSLKSDRDLTSYIGQKVDILADTKSNTVYGIKSSSDNEIIKTFADDITVSGSENSYKAEYNSIKIDISNEDAQKIENASKNAEVYIVNNADNVIVTVTEVITGEVTFVNSSKINVSATGFTAGQLTFADDDIDADISTDDFVQITRDEFNNSYKVSVLELENGTVEAKRDGEFRIDGTWYTVSSGDTNPSLNSEISYYVVGNVIYDVTATNKTTGEYALVLAVEEASGSSIDSVHRAKIITSEGVTTVVTTEIFEQANLGKIVEYSVSDGEYTFSQVTSNDLSSSSVSGNVFENNRLAGKFVNNDAVIFVNYEDDKQVVISGELLKEWDDILVSATNSNVILYTSKTDGFDYVELAYIDLGSASLPNEVGTETFAYVTNAPYEIKEDNTSYTVLSVFDGNNTFTLKSENATGVAKGDFIEFEMTDAGYTKKASVVSGGFDQVTGYASSSGNILFNTAGEAEITDDSVIIYVDSDDITGVESGSIKIATDVTGDNEKENNVFVLVKNGEVVVMFVDVNNHMQ